MIKFLKSNTDFTKLLIGEALSRFGDSLMYIAIMVLIYKITSSSAAIGILAFVSTIPNLIFLSLGGVISDRYNIKKIMLIGNVSRAVIIIMIPILIYFNVLLPIYLYIIEFFIATLDSFYMPAQGAIVPSLVSQNDLMQANSIFYAAFQIVQIIGFAIGGILVSIIGISGAFVADSISFIIAAISIILIKYTSNTEKNNKLKEKSIITSFIDGIKLIIKTKSLITVLITFLFLGVMLGPLEVIIPYFTDRIYLSTKLQSTYIGIAFCFLSIGMIIGSVITENIVKVFSLKKILMISTLIICLVTLIQSSTSNYYLFIILILFIGIFISLLRNVMITQAYSIVKPEYRGRFSSVLSFVTLSINPLMALLSGVLLQNAGFTIVFRLLSIFGLFISFIIYILVKKDVNNATITNNEGISN